jgi:hypothetical protein
MLSNYFPIKFENVELIRTNPLLETIELVCISTGWDEK